jgi:hypothetical protein
MAHLRRAHHPSAYCLEMVGTLRFAHPYDFSRNVADCYSALLTSLIRGSAFSIRPR